MTDSVARQAEKAPIPEPDDYSLVIYQNDAFVSALLQQLLNIGLPTEEFKKAVNARLTAQTIQGSGGTTASLSANLPLTSFGGRAEVRGEVSGSSDENTNAEVESNLTLQYTQANYLHNVRRELNRLNLITVVEDRHGLGLIAPGSFVMYQAFFEPNDLSTILELVTPEVVESFVKKSHRDKAMKEVDWDAGHDTLVAFQEKMKIQLESKLEVARAVTIALKQDFRNDTSREFFGLVGAGSDSAEELENSITAITLCDTQYFVGEDKDRILDGRFNVLGKVVEVSESSESVLSRNKVLKRVGQGAIERIEAELAKNPFAEMFDTDLTLEVQGPIMRVIPIAVYV